MSKISPGEKLLIKVIDDLADDVAGIIKKRREGKKVKQNLNEYFNSVDSKGPFLVEEENGPDAYINNLRQDVFDRFNVILQKAQGNKNHYDA